MTDDGDSPGADDASEEGADDGIVGEREDVDNTAQTDRATDADDGEDEEKKEKEEVNLPIGIGLADTVGGAVARRRTADDELPDDAEEKGLAFASPSLNRVEFHVHPDPEEAQDRGLLVAAQVKTLREELLHGERSHLGVARNVRLLDRRVQALLEKLAAIGRKAGGQEVTGDDTGPNPASVQAVLSDIADLRSQRADIETAREAVVEAVDKFHVYALLSEQDEVLDDLIERRTSDEFIQDYARKRIQEMIEGGDDGGADGDDHDGAGEEEYYDEHVYEDLETVYNDLGWKVAEAVATAAFDVPFLLDEVVDPARELGIDVDTFVTVSTSELEGVLADRFAAALDVAREATADLPDDAPVGDLAEPIRTAIAEQTDRPNPDRTLSDVPMPLLDVPARRETAGGPPGVGESDVTALTHTETAVGYLLAGAFRTVGDFGGALYITPDGEWQWAINPWVANEKVDIEIEGVDTYDRLWAHASVCYSVAEQLGDPPRRVVECTLCERSPSGTCGPEGCAFTELIDGVNAAMTVGPTDKPS
jgi:hypothetical protein